jgi:hypothetical protein
MGVTRTRTFKVLDIKKQAFSISGSERSLVWLARESPAFDNDGA